MKAHIGVDMTGIVHTVVDTVADVNNVTQAHALLHGEGELALDDAGYQGVHKREENQGLNVRWHIAMRPGKRRVLGRSNMGRMLESYERVKASLRSRVEPSVSGDQAPVWLYQGALSGAGQKHGAVEDVVCVGQCVGGAPPSDGDGRIGVLEMSEWRPKQAIQGEDHPDISQF